MESSDQPGTAARSESPQDTFRLGVVAVFSAMIGAVAAGTAYVVYNFIALLYNFFFFHRFGLEFVEPPTTGLPGWILVVPALGGLICGLLARFGSRKIIGHGIPEAMEAVWTNFSRVKPRIFFLKPISAAIAIGTGAPFGVEGPIIQGGGAMGSVVGQFVSTTAEERKVMLACGAAAGMAATFNTPLAAILVAIELLVFEFRARSFVPITIASVIATGVRRVIIGTGPMFPIDSVPVELFSNLPYLIVLGLLVGVAAIVFKRGYFWAEELIHRIPVNDVMLPALGGLLFGAIGLLAPRAFGVGYRVIGEILNDEIAVGLVALVMLAKVIGVTVTLGSKTSGGFLAPVFVAGAAIGSLFAHGVNTLVPGAGLSVSLFALASLGVLFGVLCNATFGFTLFALEATGHFEALVPVFLVAAVADAFAKLYMKSDLMTAELGERGVDVHQEFEVDLLQRYGVDEVMQKDPISVDPAARVTDLLDSMGAADLDRVDPRDSIGRDGGPATPAPWPGPTANGWPIIDDDDTLRGVITYGDIVRAVAAGRADQPIIEAGSTDLIVCYPGERLWAPIERMAQNDINQMPVVSRDDSATLLGWLDSQEQVATALARLDQQRVRQAGWIARLFGRDHGDH